MLGGPLHENEETFWGQSLHTETPPGTGLSAMSPNPQIPQYRPTRRGKRTNYLAMSQGLTRDASPGE